MLDTKKIKSIAFPIIITSLIVIAERCFFLCLDYLKFFEQFVRALSVLIGFLLTSAAIINSITNEKTEFIRKSANGFKNLNKDLKDAVYFSLIAIFSTITYILFLKVVPVEYIFLNYILVFINLMACFFCVFYLKTFLKIVAKG